MASTTLVDIASQYEILLRLSRHLSYSDITRLGQANHDLHSLISSNYRVHSKLKSLAICSGAGLALRRKIMSSNSSEDDDDDDQDEDCSYIASEDENWDPNVNTLTCSPYAAHPCVRCAEPICQACRSTPRSAPDPDSLPQDMHTGITAPPHKPFAGRFQYLAAHCTDCDPDRQHASASSTARHAGTALMPLPSQQLQGVSAVASANASTKELTRCNGAATQSRGHGYCDCDRFKRWICHPCQELEKTEFLQFTRRRVTPGKGCAAGVGIGAGEQTQRGSDSMFLPWVTANGSCISMMVCACGQPAHRMSDIWCFLCHRRHRSTVHYLQNGLPWRQLWYGKDEEWDEAWST